jgi:phosphoesterase RecJ-like protein
MIDNILTVAEVDGFSAMVNQAENIVVTCHVSPDGDAMGAVLAFSHYLWRKGKKATPVVPNIFPDFLKWMPGTEQVKIYDKHEEEVGELLKAADLFVCLDFNEPSRLLNMENAVMASDAPKMMIDHHLNPADFCKWVLSRHEMSSTCELLFKVLAQVEILIPSYGFCSIPPCEEFAENVCDEFFSLPLFPPASLCNNDEVSISNAACNTGSYGGCGCGCRR